MGIPKEALSRLFSRFYRAPNAGQIGGMGIGLYVSRAIAARMGGRLFIEESSSEGTVFAVEIPLAPAEIDMAPDVAVVAG